MHRPQVFVTAASLLLVIGFVVFDPHNGFIHGKWQVDSMTIDPSGGLRLAQEGAAATLVGRQVCRECHAENFALHSKHGHASTFHQLADTDLGAIFDGKTFDGGEGYGTYDYESDDQGRLVARLKSKFGDEPFPLQYVLGSGMHAQTILTLAPGVDGQTEGIEHRVSCYPGSRIGLTPGHSKMQPEEALELFGDASRGEPLARCIYCHTTSARIQKEEVVDLVANVNCEKCHGPGSEHVRQARNNPKPPAFSVGLANWDAESEIQLCGDCHRMPRSVSEKELREYSDLLTRFQPIGMLRSRCYLASDRQLRCTSCHNPHATIGQSSESDHIRNCIQCHQENHEEQVACPESPKTGCITCHMPAIELDQGIQFHDHWIRVHND